VERTPEERRAFSEHLLYELQMLFRLADRLRISTDGKDALPWDVEMACIESFAIHARALEGFLWRDPNERFPDDAFASEYFDPGVWEELRRRVQRSAIDDVAPRAGHEVAHLSYKRLKESAVDRAWPFDVIAGVFGRALRLFLENVPPDRVAADFEARLRSTWPDYLNQPVAVGFPSDQPPRAVATQMMSGSVEPARFEDLLPRSAPRPGRST
jgi:hypothetical protein